MWINIGHKAFWLAHFLSLFSSPNRSIIEKPASLSNTNFVATQSLSHHPALRFTVAKTKEYSVDLKRAAIAAFHRGTSQSQVKKDFGVSRELISSWKRKRRVIRTIENEEYICQNRECHSKNISENPQLYVVNIEKKVNEFGDVQLSVSAVKVNLRRVSPFGRRPNRKPMISAKSWTACLKFARGYQHGTEGKWSHVLRSDEGKFNLFSFDGKRLGNWFLSESCWKQSSILSCNFQARWWEHYILEMFFRW